MKLLSSPKGTSLNLFIICWPKQHRLLVQKHRLQHRKPTLIFRGGLDFFHFLSFSFSQEQVHWSLILTYLVSSFYQSRESIRIVSIFLLTCFTCDSMHFFVTISGLLLIYIELPSTWHCIIISFVLIILPISIYCVKGNELH